MSRKRKARTPTGKQGAEIKNSGYSEGGASLESNVLKNWRPRKLSAKSDINPRLDLLRSRAADQVINSPVGAAAIQTSALHAVGAGLKVFPRIKHKMLGISPEAARSWARKTALEFDLWAGSRMCDIYKRNNFYDLQDIVYTGYLTDGDSFALFRRKPQTRDMPYTLRLQIVEANRVANPDEYAQTHYNVEAVLPNGNRVVGGVELDADGATEAFWIANKVPWDFSDVDKTLEFARIKAFGDIAGMPNILQICHDTRSGQTRGVPYLAPVLATLKQVSRYTESELTASIIRSFFALFFTQQETAGGMTLDDMLPSSFDGDPHAPVVDVGEYSLAVGTMNALPRGVDVKSVDASNAQSTFDSFTTHLIKQIGAAIGQPYEVLMKNFTASYSASRAALLQAWDEYKQRRTWFARDFCQPVYEMWLAEAVAIGRIHAPGFFADPLIRKAWCSAEWFGPTMSILDPVKDINGANLRIYNGLSTREKEAAEMTGTDFEENLEQLAYEKKLIEERGLELMKPTSTNEAANSEDDSDEESKEEGEEGGEKHGRPRKKFWKIRNEADMEQAEMLLYGEIANETWWGDEVTPKDFAADPSALGGKDLLLRINSPGGDVFAATAIYNQLKDYKGKVTARIDGICASAATIVACGADTVAMPSNAVYMVHNPAVGLVGYYDGGELAHMSTYLSTVKDTIILDYQQKVGDSLSKTKLSHMMDNETWMSAQEALEAGFVDSIEDMQIESRMEGQLLNMAGVAMNLEKFKNTAHLHEILTKNVAMPATKEEKTVEDKTILQKIKDLLNGTQEPEQEKPDAAAQERERMLALDKLKTGNAFVDSIVETAKAQGQAAEEIKPYLDALPASDSKQDDEAAKVLNAIQALVTDQLNSGAGEVHNTTPKPDDDDAAKKKAAIDDVVKYANQMGGARK